MIERNEETTIEQNGRFLPAQRDKKGNVTVIEVSPPDYATEAKAHSIARMHVHVEYDKAMSIERKKLKAPFAVLNR